MTKTNLERELQPGSKDDMLAVIAEMQADSRVMRAVIDGTVRGCMTEIRLYQARLDRKERLEQNAHPEQIQGAQEVGPQEVGRVYVSAPYELVA